MSAPRVLVVDDDPEIRLAMTDVLEWEGFAVTCANDGVAALEQLRVGPRPAVIIADLMMPVMNGFELLAALRDSPDWSAIPVVVVSANQGYNAADLGVRSLLRKPVGVEGLLSAVRAALPREESAVAS